MLPVLQTVFLEASAIGLTAIFSAAMLDFTGMLGASALAVTGFAVLPYRRAQLKRALQARIQELRVKMNETLRLHFENALVLSNQRLLDSISPYRLYVQTERQKLERLGGELNSLEKQLDKLEADIQNAYPLK